MSFIGLRWFATTLFGCLLLAAGIYAPQVDAGQSVAALYKIIGTTDLGNQLRVSMHIRLINSSNDKIFISAMRLRSSHGRNEDESASLILQPHSSADSAQDFTVSKLDYELWSKGAQPQLGLRVQVNEAESTMTVPLIPQPEGR